MASSDSMVDGPPTKKAKMGGDADLLASINDDLPDDLLSGWDSNNGTTSNGGLPNGSVDQMGPRGAPGMQQQQGPLGMMQQANIRPQVSGGGLVGPVSQMGGMVPNNMNLVNALGGNKAGGPSIVRTGTATSVPLSISDSMNSSLQQSVTLGQGMMSVAPMTSISGDMTGTVVSSGGVQMGPGGPNMQPMPMRPMMGGIISTQQGLQNGPVGRAGAMGGMQIRQPNLMTAQPRMINPPGVRMQVRPPGMNASQFGGSGPPMSMAGPQMTMGPSGPGSAVNLPPRYPSPLEASQGGPGGQQQQGLPTGPNAAVNATNGPGAGQQPMGQAGNNQILSNASLASGAVPAGGGPPGGPGLPGTTGAPHSADPEKRKLIQQQLVLLLHAHKCQRRDKEQQQLQQQTGEMRQCTLPHCRTMKNVLNHMTTCQAGKNCSVPHCSSSRQIIAHWKHCNRQDCPVCLPLKQADNTRRAPGQAGGSGLLSPPGPGQQMQGQQQVSVANSMAGGVPQQQQPAANNTAQQTQPGQSTPEQVLGLQPPTFNQRPNGPVGPNQPQPRPQVPNMVRAGPPNGPAGGSMSMPTLPQQPTMHRPMGPQSVSQFSSTPNNIVKDLMEQPKSGVLSNELQNTVSAAPIQSTKEWHASVTPDLRNHLVHKLVQAIFPTPDPQAMLDKRMQNLVAYAKKVEGDMYEMANSRSEYYHLLAEKIYKIQKELEEKRAKRKQNQEMGQQGPVAANQAGQQNQMQPGQQQMMRQEPQPRLMSPSPSQLPNRNLTPGLPQSMPFNHMSQADGSGPTSTTSMGDPLLRKQLEQTPAQANLRPLGLPLANSSQNPTLQNQLSQPPSSGASRLEDLLTKAPQQDIDPAAMERAKVLIPKLPTEGLNPVTASAGLPGPAAGIVSQSSVPTSQPPTMVGASNVMQAQQQQQQQAMSAGPSGASMDTNNSLGMPNQNAGGHGQLDDKKPLVDGIKTEIKTEDIKTEPMETAEPEPVKQEVKTEAEIKTEVKEEPGSGEAPKEEEQKTVGTISKDEKTGKNKVSFTSEELRNALMPPLMKMYDLEPEAAPFRIPVDPTALGIPDYFDIIKRPMDMSYIKRKLDTGQYKDPWEFVNDVFLMFDNAWIYNRKTSRVYRYCTKLSEVFEAEIDPVMQGLGFCCGKKHTYSPQTLCCYGGQLCTIARDVKYYYYENKNPTPSLFNDRYSFCDKCFTDIPGETVALGDDPSQPQTHINKTDFKMTKNDVLESEPFVECTDCGRKLHQVCVLHFESIWREFKCDGCHKAAGSKRKENRFTAKKLPCTRLGSYIETRVNNFLRKKEADAGDVHIRVVFSGDKNVEVKPGMKKRYVDTGEMQDNFPYRARAMFAFVEQDGVDVCFFGLHVQEYGSECAQPNTRRVYVAYLDSVHFFKPRHFRTAVYHEILLGYLDYMKKLGYTMAHIWACPPSEGDDYIFHMHPSEQKIPKPKRLQEWYKKMLDKGIIERIVLDYKDIYKQAIEDNIQSPAELPYFEGDFWPNVMEENIKELEQEEEARKRELEEAERLAAAAEAEEAEAGASEVGTDGKNPQGKKKNQKKKKSNAQRKASQKKTPQGSSDLTSKVFATMEKHKEVFFTIRLHSAQSAASLNPIQDPDPLMPCDLMDGRDAFLTLARDKHYEFSSLRRCKYSTMAMLYELHTQGQDKFVYNCNTCSKSVETRYHCTVCDDFDLCVGCYKKDGHPHKMEKLGFDLGGDGEATPSSNPQEARKLSIQRCIQSLVHACQCRDANCRLPSCHKMKRVVSHTKQCKRKTNGGCPICKQLIALCCYHAKLCQEAKCPVPFCLNIKQKLRQQQLQQRLQEAAMMRRRMAQMNERMNPGSVANRPQKPVAAVVPAVAQMSAINKPGMTSASQGKPMAGQPNQNVLDAVKKVQEEAQRQSQPGNFVSGKGGAAPMVGMSSPPMPAQMNQGMQIQQQQQQQGQQPNWQQQGQRFPQQQQMSMARPGIAIQGGPPGAQPNMPGTGSGQRQTMQSLQQLIQALKSPQSPQQQQQVLQILKSNPSLMAAFIKQRANQQNQSGQGGPNAGQPVPNPNQMGPNGPMNQMQQGTNQMMGPGGATNMVGMNQGMMAQSQGVQGPQNPMNINPQNPMNQQMMQQQRYRAIHLQQQPGQYGQGQFQQPAPPYQRARQPHPGMKPGFQGDVNQFQRGPSPGMMGQQMLGQQMLSQVRSPPPGMPVRSPNPTPSPRPVPVPVQPGMTPSPHSQQMNSPHSAPAPSPHHVSPHGGHPLGAAGAGPAGGGVDDVNGSSHTMLGQPTMASNMNMQQSLMDSGGPGQDGPSMTPQDQLSKFVETL